MLLVEELVSQESTLQISTAMQTNGCRVIDAGIQTHGSIEAGLLIAEVCLGGLGHVSLQSNAQLQKWPLWLNVRAKTPVIACLGSQYAGWALSHKDENNTYYALGSGPARSIGSKEPLFEELVYREKPQKTALVIEADKPPPVDLTNKIAENCKIPAKDLTVIITPTSSIAGCVQIVARVLETALHKVHTLGFPLEQVIDGVGSAPLPPPAPNTLTAMSRTNDAILFAGTVHLFVDSDDAKTEALAKQLPSSASKDYGKPFGKIFKEVKYDFFKIDPMLFSPANVVVTSLKSGNTFHAGQIDEALTNLSFSQECE